MREKKIVLLTLLTVLLISCGNSDNNGGKGTEIKKTAKIRVGYMPDFSGTSAAAIALEKDFLKRKI